MKLSTVVLLSQLSMMAYAGPSDAKKKAEKPIESAENAEDEKEKRDSPTDSHDDSAEDFDEYAFDDPTDPLAAMCHYYQFPKELFGSQEENKAYDTIEKIGVPADLPEGVAAPFTAAGVDRFINVFGIKVVLQEGVAENKALHVAKYLKGFLDHDNDGVVDYPEYENIVKHKHPVLFIMKDVESISALMNPLDEEDEKYANQLPEEMRHCMFAFDFEVENKILPGGGMEDATCSEEEDFDRTIGFVNDHVIGRGYTAVFNAEERAKIASIYENSLKDGFFYPENSGCVTVGATSSHCNEVMYTSWAASTVLGIDKCWCESSGAMKYCDQAEFAKADPDMRDFLINKFPVFSDFIVGADEETTVEA